MRLAFSRRIDDESVTPKRKTRATVLVGRLRFSNGIERKYIPTLQPRFCVQSEGRSTIDALNVTRRRVWAEQPDHFFECATVDLDGTLTPTTGQCKQGMDIAYNGVWGYHPLIVSLANTGEILSVVNRSGNRPSHENAAREVDRALYVCLQG